MKALILSLILLAVPSLGSAEITQDMFDPGGVGTIVPEVGRDRIAGRNSATGKMVWAVSHPSAGYDQRTKEIDYPLRGPVEFEGNTLYSIRGDLLTVDTARGIITARQQYPAMISDLIVEDDKLFVELDIVTNSHGETTKVRTPYKPGFVPGRGPWESFAMVALRPAADVPDLLTDEEKFKAHSTKWTAVRALLRKAEVKDPTNPMLPAYRGLAAHADGDVDAANAAFAKAIVTPSIWHEKVQLCGLLERARRPGLARSTCTAAKEAMIAAGVRPEAMLSLVAYVVMTKDMRIAMADAVARDDVDSVVRIATYTYEIFPNVEAGFMAWDALARWLADKKDPRAKVWETRARELATSPMARAMWGRARAVDLWLLLLAAIFLALPLAGFALGVRRTRETTDSRFPWLPRLSVLEVLVVVGVLVSVVPISVASMTQTAAIAMFAEAPIASMQEGYGSPNVVDWIKGQPDSPARTRVLEYAEHELEMVKAGKPVTKKPPAPDDVLVAIEELAKLKGEHDALSLDFTSDPFAEVSVPNATPFAFPGALAFLVLAVAGRMIRRKLPEIADTLSKFVPGANAGLLAPVVAVSLVGGLLYLLTPIGSILQSIAIPAFDKYFGLQALGSEASLMAMYPADSVWPWAAVLGACAVHAVTTFVALKKQED